MLTKIAGIILRAYKRNRVQFRLRMKTSAQAAPVFLRPSQLLSSDKANEKIICSKSEKCKSNYLY